MLPKLRVTGSNPASRSQKKIASVTLQKRFSLFYNPSREIFLQLYKPLEHALIIFVCTGRRA